MSTRTCAVSCRPLTHLVITAGLWVSVTGIGPLANSLYPNQLLPVGSVPLFVVTGDFNGDGKDDLAASNFDSNDISIVLGDGDGGFSSEKRTMVGTAPFGMAAADFNGDGRDDLAVGNYRGHDVSILLSLGDGRFRSAQTFSVGTIPISIGAADFNGDGRTDLVVVDQGESEAVILLGLGDGTFIEVGRLANGISPTAVILADLNRDDRIDLALAGSSSRDVAIFLGRGDGTFDSAGSFAVGDDPEAMVAADLNGDEIFDLATANSGSDDVSVLIGLGDGTFATEARYGTLDSPASLAALDFDGDGMFDLALANPGSGGALEGDLTMLRGVGGGLFAPATPLGAGPGFTAVATGSFDSVPRADLVALRARYHTPGEISVFMNGSLAPRSPQPLLIPMPGLPREVVSADFNADGIADLASIFGPEDPYTTEPNAAGVWLGTGDGSFVQSDILPIDPSPVRLVAGDLDGDGIPDLIVLSQDRGVIPGDLRVFLGHGDGTFHQLAPFGMADYSLSIALGDMTGDGRLDLIAGNAAASGGDVSVRPGNGDGTFGTELVTPIGHWPYRIVVADFNEDGLQDLALAGVQPYILLAGALPSNVPPGSVSILLGHGDGRFEPEKFYVDQVAGSNLVSGDFNGDGHEDLGLHGQVFVDPYYDARTLVLLGAGDGTFAEQPPFAIGTSFSGLMLADDADGDGKIDLIGFTYVRSDSNPFFSAEQHILVYRGLGDGRFDTPLVYREFNTPGVGQIVSGDFNRDGRRDLAVGCRLGASIWLNQGPLRAGRPPVAVATSGARYECSSPAGATVRLDGSGSTDPDSSPGTHDDIMTYEWFEDFATAGERSIGAGQILDVSLPLGPHHLKLRVADRAGAIDTDDVSLEVVDTTPPTVTTSVVPSELFPPNHRLVSVTITVRAVDVCGGSRVVLESVHSSEPDDAPGGSDGSTTQDIQGAAVGTADYDLQLRAERLEGGPGRVYTLVYAATDDSGNTGRSAATVRVPGSKRKLTAARRSIFPSAP